MNTDELIRALRDRANLFGIMRDSSNRDLLNAAADRLEYLDERVSIMMEGTRLNQNERILEHLKKYGSITPKEADAEYGVMRLGARIHELKKEGNKILTTKEKALNKYGEKVCYARYKLMN